MTTPRPRVFPAWMYPLFLLLGVCLAMLALGYVENTFPDRTQEQYCRMVHDYRTSDGVIGWPDYDNRFDADCTPEGEVRHVQ